MSLLYRKMSEPLPFHGRSIRTQVILICQYPIYCGKRMCPAVSVLDDVNGPFPFAGPPPHSYPVTAGSQDKPSYCESNELIFR